VTPPDAIARFTGFADLYDRVRPRPPAAVAELICQWGRTAEPDVVDLGAGTGLSTRLWAGRAARVVAVEPSADMRAVAARRFAALPAEVTLWDGTAEATGLPGRSADVVTAGQAMHWFDPGRTLPEVARLLRTGGVFAAYDCAFPPAVDAETDAAYRAFAAAGADLDVARGLRPPYAEKVGHAERIRRSGLFRYVTEVALHSREEGDAGRLVDLALSQGGAVALLAAGGTEEELELTRLREVAGRRLPAPVPWWWTYRVVLAVR
jgi:SAM-dependent methyltransferase